eukprot:comp5919_c0_seq1/m.1773 comp5919_c0_seq1/g.1773  ORF comp5919_c0_seq1/g.1773 comp5919_c0_seq1/m.1773 type:complete len:300 (-) comp5919_c0_seq1:24-923(-)
MADTGAQKRPAKSGGEGQRKRNKSYYRNYARANKEGSFQAGSRGVMVTCDHITSTKATAEALELLEEYANKLFPVEGGDASSEDESGSVADALKKEIESLRGSKDKDEDARRIVPLDMDRTRGILFLQCDPTIDPVILVHGIMQDLDSTKLLKSRFIQRLVPVVSTCKSHVEEIEKAVRPIVEPIFHQPDQQGYKYAVWYRARNNEALDRMTVINAVATIVAEGDKGHKVDLTAPEWVVIVEVVGKYTCLSVVQDFYKYKKYNVHEVVGQGDSLRKQQNKKEPEEKKDAAKDTEEVKEQ